MALPTAEAAILAAGAVKPAAEAAGAMVQNVLVDDSCSEEPVPSPAQAAPAAPARDVFSEMMRVRLGLRRVPADERVLTGKEIRERDRKRWPRDLLAPQIESGY